MYIREIAIKKFRHIEDVRIGPFILPANLSDLVVLAGPNGGGKSSVLELIGFALSNTWSLGWQLSRSMPQNSFEISIALSDAEKELLRDYSDTLAPGFNEEALTHILDKGFYWRGFNFKDGEYVRNSGIYNQVHAIVTSVLRTHYERPLGFFLKPDRVFKPSTFKKAKIFDFHSSKTAEYRWGMAFNTSEAQYQDIFDVLVQQRYHYHSDLGRYHDQIAKGASPSEEPPTDPLVPYNDLLKRIFPDYEFAEKDERFPEHLYVRIPSGELIQFSDLSSGEKEVFFMLAFFLRQNVNNAVILIDEPELHLHPELARNLMRQIQAIQPSNQIWVASHNPEVIDEAGSDRVVYFDRDRITRKAKVTVASDENILAQKLKSLIGYSGYIGTGKRLVFLEGRESSTDKKLFSRIFPGFGSEIKFIPVGSADNFLRLNNAILSLLNEGLANFDYYMIRDHDYLTEHMVEKYREKSSNRIYVLNKFHIENYLLDDDLISSSLEEFFGVTKSKEEIGERLRSIAKNMSSEVIRDMLSFRINSLYYGEDISLGNFGNDQPYFSEEGNKENDLADALASALNEKIGRINTDLTARTSSDQLAEMLGNCEETVRSALFDSGDRWRETFPGKRMLEILARQLGIGRELPFRNTLIREMAADTSKIPPELNLLIERIAKGDDLS